MTDTIIDSKFRILEQLQNIAGRQRYVVSDLISGRVAVLELVPIDGFESMRARWTSFFQPSLRERAERFTRLPSFVPVSAVGAWTTGPYYVYEQEHEENQPGGALPRLPTRDELAGLLTDLDSANKVGDHACNLRPEFLRFRGERLRVLPGAYVLPLELVARASARSPYQPPELRHAGILGSTTDGYLIAGVLQALVERTHVELPDWWNVVSALQALEPWRRLSLRDAVDALTRPGGLRREPERMRRSVERFGDLLTDARLGTGGIPPGLIETLDVAIAGLAEGRSSVVILRFPPGRRDQQQVFAALHETLTLLTERPNVSWLDPLTSLELRDWIGAGSRVVLVPDWQPNGPELLPVERLLAASEKLRPCSLVIGLCSDVLIKDDDTLASEWLRRQCRDDVSVFECALDELPQTRPVEPASPAARHLLDLLSVLEAEAPIEMLRLALPQQEADLPEALVALEALGHTRRLLTAGGWWGPETRMVLCILQPDVMALRRQSLTADRREELHLLVSHLLHDLEIDTLGSRYLRFYHLFAGGNWQAAAAECGPLLKWLQRSGLDALALRLQRQVANSNLATHWSIADLLEVLRSLGEAEVARGRVAEGRSYYERALERLFSLPRDELGAGVLPAACNMLLAHADLLERDGDSERALELLQRYIGHFDEHIPAVERGRVFSEIGFCDKQLGRFAAAEEHCGVALKLLDPRRNPSDVAQVYNVLGSVFWKNSRYDEAEQYYNGSLALREKIGDRLGIARTYNNLGLLERSRRRFSAALEFHRKSMEIRQELGDNDGVARTLVNLAWVYFEMRDLVRAEEYAQRAEQLRKSAQIRSVSAVAMGLLGEIYLADGRLDAARQALDEATQQAREVGDQAELFMDLRKLADVELRCGDVTRAAALLEESEQYLARVGSPLEEAHWYLTQGNLRAAGGDDRGAATSYEHAGNNFARVGDAQRAGDLFVKATRLYVDTGLAARAHDLVVRARRLYESDTAVVPAELATLEAAMDKPEPHIEIESEAALALDAVRRACAIAATTPAGSGALQQLLEEMRRVGGARCAILLRTDGEPHPASALAPTLEANRISARAVLSGKTRLVTRALHALLPLSSRQIQDDEADTPFYTVPVEVRDHTVGCVFLEWSPADGLPEEESLRNLQTVAQLVGLVLERNQADVAGMPAVRGAERRSESSGGEEASLDDIVGRSPARQAIIEFVRRVRDHETSVLIMGENGTGKEVVARAIHYTGARRHGPYVAKNCTAIPAGLWERELCGHERGAFTDAHETKPGYLEAAHGGTLLLDEIGDMPWEMQTKFLRVLEQKVLTRIGGTEERRVDVRIIAATNQDLELAIEKGRFRRDLYHRLPLVITLPPLRERREDIPVLAQHFLEVHAKRLGVPPKRMAGESLRILMRYPWPGNIRELENVIRGALVIPDKEVLVPEMLPAAVLRGADNSPAAGALPVDDVARWVLDHAAYSADTPLMEGLEKALARQLVEKLGEKTLAARLLGISKPTLYNRLKRAL